MYNISGFDINFLYDAKMRLLSQPLTNDFVDTLAIARKILKNLEHHKLATLTEYFSVENKNAHRALSDCYATKEVFDKLKQETSNHIDTFDFDKSILENKKVFFSSGPKLYPIFFYETLFEKFGCSITDGSNFDYDYRIGRFKDWSEFEEKKCVWTSEECFLDKLNIPYPKKKDIDVDAVCPSSFDVSNPFYGKKIVFKGDLSTVSLSSIKKLCEKCGAKFSEFFYENCDYLVFSKTSYQKWKRGDFSEKMIKAKRLEDAGTLSVLSEFEFLDALNVNYNIDYNEVKTSAVNTKNIIPDTDEFDTTNPVYGKYFVFTGALEEMQRQEAMQYVVNFGGYIGNSITKKTNFLVLANDHYNPQIKGEKSRKWQQTEELKLKGQDIEIISEDVFYDMLADGGVNIYE